MSEYPGFEVNINYEQYGEDYEGESWFGERYLEVQAVRRSRAEDGAERVENYRIPFDEHTSTPDIIKGLRVMALVFRGTDRVKAVTYRDIARQLEEISAPSTD